MAVRIGVEIGGTFTDLITVGKDGRAMTAKVPSTPWDLSEGVMAGLHQAAGEELSGLDEVMHGSTVATNALLERKGAKIGLLSTKGFRDVLLIQRQERDEIYELFYRKPEALVPRELTRGVAERVDVDGRVVQEVDAADLYEQLDALLEQADLDLLVVAFLSSYVNPANERSARDLIAERHPDLKVMLASDIAPIFREYERTSTAVISAFVKPVVERYLGSIESNLDQSGFAGEFSIMQSNGGLTTVPGAIEQPAQMLNSGPASGVIGAIEMAKALGEPNVVTLDTGGTSTDVCVITDGEAEMTQSRRVDGLPLHIESTDIVSVGAGGGSVAWRDEGGLLRVGPQSAGADPGPACYGRGGDTPTVTDALVVLGWLRPDHFLGGGMALDVEAAKRVVAALAAEFGLETEEMAESIFRIGVANMNDAMRIVSVSRGYDPRDYALMAFGGSGGLHAAFVADELNIGRIIVPAHAGIFSAFGLLVADLKHNYQETHFSKLSETAPTQIRASFERLAERAVEDFKQHGIDAENLQFSYSIDLRYLGQGYELTLDVDPRKLSEDSIRGAFSEAHQRRYGNRGLGGEIELVTYRLSAVSERSRAAAKPLATNGDPKLELDRIFLGGKWIDCTFFDSTDLFPGMALQGPVIIEDAVSTTIVPPNWRATVHESGSLTMEAV